MEKLLKIGDVIATTKLSKSVIYALAKKGCFPRPIKLTPHSSAWVESEVDERIKKKMEMRK